jgi:hypothetical protein
MVSSLVALGTDAACHATLGRGFGFVVGAVLERSKHRFDDALHRLRRVAHRRQSRGPLDTSLISTCMRHPRRPARTPAPAATPNRDLMQPFVGNFNGLDRHCVLRGVQRRPRVFDRQAAAEEPDERRRLRLVEQRDDAARRRPLPITNP